MTRVFAKELDLTALGGTFPARFWSKVDVGHPDECWEWRGARITSGYGNTALVAKALGRHGISLDMSADYCRLAQWRTSDEGELARALLVEKPAKQVDGQWSLFEARP